MKSQQIYNLTLERAYHNEWEENGFNTLREFLLEDISPSQLNARTSAIKACKNMLNGLVGITFKGYVYNWITKGQKKLGKQE